MKSLPTHYDYQEVETRISQSWIDAKRYRSEPSEKTPYVLVVPPPNVTGVLHLGHTLNATIQDILARQARIEGLNVCWVSGSDHASIATEVKVIEMLKKEHGIDKKDLSRSDFLAHAYAWKEKYGGIIYKQFERLGCSMDWSRTTFTMDAHYSEAIQGIFVRLFEQGYLYKGQRMIHWDVAAQTALSDEEVEYRDEETTLYYVKYVVEGSESDFVRVATQRPETIMGDVAICVHPDDERYKKYHGKKVVVPIADRAVPVICDMHVDPSFGTGVLKITPAHSPNDFDISRRHHLPFISTFDLDGKVKEEVSIASGKTIAEAKKEVISLLNKCRLIEKEERYTTRIGYSQRTSVRVEPFLSEQWFVRMTDLATKARTSFEEGSVKFYPEKRFTNAFLNWMNGIRDWCISRQLWWGHQIPAWYDDKGRMVVAMNEQEAYEKYAALEEVSATEEELRKQKALRQDEDCLDTWFSSWIWPIELFKGITKPKNDSISYYYPTSVLVTGHDILFFWVARMMMAGEHFMDAPPFRDVYFTGMVRDKLGRKMSKSLGNSPDLNLLIETYGADAVRFGVMIAAPAGNDLLFEEKSLEQGRHFINKLWNVWKLLHSWSLRCDAHTQASKLDTFTIAWLQQLTLATRNEIQKDFGTYRLNEAMKKVYVLIWDHFCNTGIEWLKRGKDNPISEAVYHDLLLIWRSLLQMLHPFMPFITEELYNVSHTPGKNFSLIDEGGEVNLDVQKDASFLKRGLRYASLLSHLREAKQRYHIRASAVWEVEIVGEEDELLETLLLKMLRCQKVRFVGMLSQGILFAPYNGLPIGILCDSQGEHQQLQNSKFQKDLAHQEKQLASINKKLASKHFITNASSAVIARERKKHADTLARIATIKENLELLS